MTQVGRRHLHQPIFTFADDALCQRLFILNHLVNPFFQRAQADKFMHQHVARLPDAEGAVGGLIFHGRIPPAVKVKYMIGAGQIQPRAARF